jgi:hypothetical protein
MEQFKESFTGKYDGVASPLLLVKGGITDGKNMRKVSSTGGWKARKGLTLHNTTAIAAAPVLSLHSFTHPRNADFHFLAQCNAKIYAATNNPPTAGTTFGTDMTNSKVVSASVPGFSDTIEDTFIYTDGNYPLCWGGDNPLCTGFLSYDSSEVAYNDHTIDVTDGRTDTTGLAVAAASDVWYVCSPEIAKALVLDLGTGVNSSAATLTLKSWQSGAWSDRTATDGTLSSGKTMAVDGSITWNASANDTMRVMHGIMGYWYQITFSGALSNSVDIVSCKVQYDLARMTNKWDGVYELPAAVRFYDQSADTYKDVTGDLSTGSTAQALNLADSTTSDFLYIKSITPLTGIGLAIAVGMENTATAVFDSIEDWDGDSWNAVTTGIIADETKDVTGGTKSLTQSGTFWWNAVGRTVKRRTMTFDSVPGYWYRLSWSAAFDNTDSTVNLYYVTVVPLPEVLGPYDGVLEFKGRTCLWGDKQYPNRLRFSAYEKPDCFAGSDSCYTDAFGAMDKIVGATRFYNELLVFKRGSVYLLEGYQPANFGILKVADTVGCCAPQTIQQVEVGFPSMHADEPLTIVIWCDTDGVYVIDGRKPRKVSMPVDQYFNIEYSTAIPAASLSSLRAEVDPLRNEYHLIIPGNGDSRPVELVYNYMLDEWYPPFSRAIGRVIAPNIDYLTCVKTIRSSDNRYYTYGGNNVGLVCRLEYDTTDKTDENADVVIMQNLKTRAIFLEQDKSLTFTFDFRGLTIEAKARAAGTVVTRFYKDLAASGTTLVTPSALNLVNAGYSLCVDTLDTSQLECNCFQLEFEISTADVELEIYDFNYLVESRGVTE